MEITARYEFESAHRLRDPALSEEENARVFGPCARMHGHTYLLEITLSGERLVHGMMLNLNEIDTLVKERIISQLDHRTINDLPHFKQVPATAEEIARWVWQELQPLIESDTARLERVTVFEGKRFSATVTREDALIRSGR